MTRIRSRKRKPRAAWYSWFFWYWDQEKEPGVAAGCFGAVMRGKKERDGVGVGVEGGAVMAAEFDFFAAHNEGVDENEINQEKGGGEPGVHGDGGADGEDAAAEIERIAGASVGAGGGEEGLFCGDSRRRRRGWRGRGGLRRRR